ncbi:ABC transporter permease [Acidobacteriota bacterium]
MIRNYIITSLRNIRRHKGYSFINVTGLAIGLACSFFILLWVQDEMSYDKFLPESDQIYSVMRHTVFAGKKGTGSGMPKPIAQVLVEDYPEITHTVLVSRSNEMVLTYDHEAFRSEGRYFGSDFFTVFKFPLIVGDPVSALLDPESIAISESLAERSFGIDWREKKDLLGSMINVDHRLNAKLTAVFEDVPANSSIQFEFVIPVQEFIRRNDWLERWDNNGLGLFARLDEGVDPEVVNAKIKDLIDQHVDAWESDVFLQPYTDMYLWSNFENGVLVGGRIEYVRIFLFIAVFIILIASINFMNLSTARSAQRAREIGVRKTVGATKSSLSRQFIGESLLTAMIAFIIAMISIFLLLPSFNQLTGKSIHLSLADPGIWLQFGGLALFAGLLAGFYPALYLSSFSVVSVLRSGVRKKARGGGLRKGLVVFQFVMSIILIIGTLTVYRQLNYIRNKALGVDRENVISLAFEGNIRDQFDAFKQELLNKPGLMNVTLSNQNPLAIGQNTIGVEWDGKLEGDNTLYNILSTGYDFVDTMRIQMKAGRIFGQEFSTDSSNYIINERAAKAMGMDNPLGQRLAVWGQEGHIIGVVKDFHMRSLYQGIEPVIMRLAPGSAGIIYVRIAAGETRNALASLERVHNQFNPEYPFNYRFLDEDFEQTYRSETVIGTLANIFAVLAVSIACLGLLGLASFTAEQRNKEIAIRKVLGSSVLNIIMLLSREFILLVVGAYVAALPIAYILMSKWLDDFAFHTKISVGVLIGAGVLSVMIAWLTVSYQSMRAATTDPVLSLRLE